jgi:hypothetical protein
MDHTYTEFGPGGRTDVTYVSEPYGNMSAEGVRNSGVRDIAFLREHGYTIEISDAGQHNPGHTIRIAITPPANEAAARQAYLRTAREAASAERVALRASCKDDAAAYSTAAKEADNAWRAAKRVAS